MRSVSAKTMVIFAVAGMVAPADLPSAGAGTAPLNLASLIREAAERSPALAAARSRVLAAEATPSQAEALPDPLVTVSYQNESLTDWTFGHSPDSFLSFSWTQELPYSGKREAAGEVARSEITVSQRRLDRIWLETVAGIKRAYADLYRIDRTATILSESRELLRSFLDTARARYEVGEGILENVLKAQTEITKLDADLAKLVQERASAAALLIALAGRRDDAAAGPVLDLPETSPLPDVADLEKEALARSPEILEMEAAARREEARLDLARRQLKPDLMWGASYANRGELDPMIMGTFGVRLPLSRNSKQVQGIIQARHEAEAAGHEVESARLRLLAEIRDLAARAARAGTLSRLFAEGVLPQARSALDSAAAAYGVGRADFLTLLEDFRTLLSYEIDHETQRAERVSALAALEPLTGRALIPVSEGGAASEGGRHE